VAELVEEHFDVAEDEAEERDGVDDDGGDEAEGEDLEGWADWFRRRDAGVTGRRDADAPFGNKDPARRALFAGVRKPAFGALGHTKILISLSSRTRSRSSAAFSKSRFFAASFISLVRRLMALSRSSPSPRSSFDLWPGPGASSR